MDAILPDIRPQGRAAFVTSYTFEGVSIRIHLRWLPTLRRWLCSLQDPAGELLTPETIVCAGGELFPDPRDPRVPVGRWRWVGPEEYQREDLGEGLQLEFTPTDEPTPLTLAQLLGSIQ